MIACDQYVAEFLARNMLTIGITIMLIKGIANITPGKVDDKIAELFESIFSFATQRKK